jgi:threonine dehydrogenase-like Zn-dependent dehydrogenase
MARFSSVLVCLVAVKSAAAFAPAPRHAARSSALQMTTATGAKGPIKVGVIGCGRIGIVHLGAINKAPGVIPIVVSNPTISKAESGE